MRVRIHEVGPMERALYLKTVPVLRVLRPTELAVVAEHARERSLRRGTTFIQHDERPGAMYVIVQGGVRVEGGEYPAPVSLGTEQTVGFLDLLAGSESGIEAVTEADTLLLELDADLIFDLLEEHFYVMYQVIRDLARMILAERRTIPDGELLGLEEDLVPPARRQLDLVERIALIRRGTTFNRVSMNGVARLARSLTDARFEPGDVLWEAGQPSGYLYVVLSGRARCTRPGDPGTFRCGGGYPMGNIESLAGERRWYTATAETPMWVVRANSDTFLDVLEDDFEMALSFIEAFASNLIGIRRRKIERVREPVPGR